MRQLLLITLVFCASATFGQLTFTEDQSVIVRNENNDPLLFPWAGGINSGQFNTIDLDLDGTDDLIVFDRMTGQILTFLYQDGHYAYAPDYQTFFPSALGDWVLLRDFNCDGKKDLFTREDLGIVAYRNITPEGGPLAFERYTPTVIFTQGFNLVNLLPGFNDIPTITDADGDGDLDILNFRFSGTSTIEYHKNLSMETYGTCDSLKFERLTQKYGDLEECLCGSFAFNGTECPAPPGGRIEHTSGRSLLAHDLDGDGDLDILFSEENCNRLYFLENTGTTEAPVFNGAVLYPEINPVDKLYPVPFYESVTGDPVNDLIVSTGLLTNNIVPVDFAQSAALYSNGGSNSNPVFDTPETFLQNDMIDVGDNAVPAFFDEDGDGDLDLFISNNYNTEHEATIRLFKNTGNALMPEFKLTDIDYALFSSSDFYNLKIQFADINRDGKNDLVFSATTSATAQTALYYLANSASQGLSVTGSPVNIFNISSIGENVHVGDVNGDGINDLLVGKSDGSLEYWKNISSGPTPGYVLQNSSYLGIGPDFFHFNLAPFIADLNGDGKPDLLLGDQQGNLRIIENFRSTGETATYENIVLNPLTEEYEARNFGGSVWPVAANIFNDRPAVVLGTRGGGVHILRNETLGSPGSPQVRIFPNPVDLHVGESPAHVTIRSDRPGSVQLISIMGQQLGSPVMVEANTEISYLIPPAIQRGIYILHFSFSGRSFARRLVIL